MTKSSPNSSVLGLSLNADSFFCSSDGSKRGIAYQAELSPMEHFILYGGNLTVIQNQQNAEYWKQGREAAHYGLAAFYLSQLLEEAGNQSTVWGTVTLYLIQCSCKLLLRAAALLSPLPPICPSCRLCPFSCIGLSCTVS